MALRESQRLEQSARKVAFGRMPVKTDIRMALRNLTLNAFQSRVLTLPHVAAVIGAIEQGIDPSKVEALPRAPGVQAMAIQGLELALSKALEALDLASRQYVSVGGRLSENEVGQWVRALDALPKHAGIAARTASIRTSLLAAEGDEVIEGTYVLGLLATGALLGLLESETRSKSVK